MQIGPLTTTDWPLFKTWAADEGWDISFQEERLFLNFWQRYFYVLRHRGDCCGFISAIAYKDSGWIGNLLINPEKRLQGYGRILMQYAIDFFNFANIPNIWLLCQNPLSDFYRKFDFEEYDQVKTRTADGLGSLPQESSCELDDLIALNTRCWGETQRPLHDLLEVNSIPLQAGSCMSLLQTGPTFWQLGPCIAEDVEVNSIRQLLSQALGKTPANKPLLIHALHGNDLDLTFKSAGFSTVQTRTLMYNGVKAPALSNVLALASNGSFG